MTTATQQKTILHVGCGPYNPALLPPNFHNGEWKEVRLDINPDVNPDIIGDITNMASVQTGSMDALWSAHNLEHLYPHQVPEALKEFHRVLNPNGIAFIALPDLQAVAEHVAAGRLEEPMYESPAGPISAIDVLYGLRPAMAKGNLYMAHKTGFTDKTLAEHLTQAGFKDVSVQRIQFDLFATAYKS